MRVTGAVDEPCQAVRRATDDVAGGGGGMLNKQSGVRSVYSLVHSHVLYSHLLAYIQLDHSK